MPPVLLVGLDGATKKMLDPLYHRGAVPAMEKLINEGFYGRIQSIDHALSPALWTSVATGKYPEKHAITSFVKIDKESAAGVPFRSSDRKTKALWNILSEQGRNVGVFNWLVTFPPEKVNGFVVSDYYPYDRTAASYPEVLGRVLTRPRMRRGLFSKLTTVLNAQQRILQDNVSNALRLQRVNTDMDLFAVYTRALDDLQHTFWPYVEPGPLHHDLSATDRARYSSAVSEAYCSVDRWIAQMMRSMPRDTVVIIMSDHGFKTSSHVYYPLDFRKITRAARVPGCRESCAYHDGSHWITVLSCDDPARIADVVAGLRTRSGRRVYDVADMARNTIVLRQELIDEDTVTLSGKNYATKKFIDRAIFENQGGEHDYDDGIVIISGPNIKKGGHAQISLVDIAPTILYLLGEPVARDMDGRVVFEIFHDGFTGRHPARYVESYESVPAVEDRAAIDPDPSALDAHVLKRLRSLGYMQ